MTEQDLNKLLRELYLDAECTLPRTTISACEKVLAEESNDLSKVNMKALVDDLRIAAKNRIPTCSDTGNPIWYVILGTEALPILRDGVPALERLIKKVTSELTEKNLIQALMVDPLKHGINTNVGDRIPDIQYQFRDSDYIELIATPKGCGAETFGSYFKVLMYADGIFGMKKYILDVVIEGARAGRTCPPNIVGVGIGGTSDLCPRIAKEAALLRPVGDRHPDSGISALEEELLAAINATGIGPAGMGGKYTALDVHIETAFSNIVGVPVAVNIQCPATHLSVARIYSDGRVERREQTSWFER
jgi:fumarate hydratase subunit alpha